MDEEKGSSITEVKPVEEDEELIEETKAVVLAEIEGLDEGQIAEKFAKERIIKDREVENVYELVRRDQLTGHLNDAGWLEALVGYEAHTGRVEGERGSILYLDIDRFKEDINDTWGHMVGDLVIQEVGAVLGDTMRTSDKIARLHGDEFAVLLEATDEDGAKRARERIVNALKGDKMLQSEDDILGQIAIELSIGIGTMQGGKPIQEIYKEAEADMRKIKKEKGVGR